MSGVSGHQPTAQLSGPPRPEGYNPYCHSGTVCHLSLFVDLFRLYEVLDFSSSRLIEVMEGPLDVPVSDSEAVQEPKVFLGAWAFSLAMGSHSQGAESLILLVVAAMGCPLYGGWSILNMNRFDRVQYHGVLGLAWE